MNGLDGKVALISGAARGIGGETARLMATAGASIHPGVIQTDMGEQTFVARVQRSGSNDTARVRQTVTETVPWGRLGVPLDIAKGILFLASDDADYMNGAGLIVDIGYVAA